MNRLIAKYGHQIVPIIDAAQGRFSRRGLRDYVSRVFTGDPDGIQVRRRPACSSGAPASARAVLAARSGHNPVPGRVSPTTSTPAQLPAEWTAARRSLEQTANSGLLIRWMAAMEEMRAYYETPSWARYRVLRSSRRRRPSSWGSEPPPPAHQRAGSDSPRPGRAAPRVQDDRVQLPGERAEGCAAQPGHPEAMGPLDESRHLLARAGGHPGAGPRRRRRAPVSSWARPCTSASSSRGSTTTSSARPSAARSSRGCRRGYRSRSDPGRPARLVGEEARAAAHEDRVYRRARARDVSPLRRCFWRARSRKTSSDSGEGDGARASREGVPA